MTGFGLTGEVYEALDRVRAGDMRGDLSFLASDLLKGRNTPSPGLEIAAEYVAAQFRGAGLEPGGDEGYFQNARMSVLEQDVTGFELTLSGGGHQLTVKPDEAVVSTTAAVDLVNVPVFKVDVADAEALTPAQLDAKVVLVDGRQAAGRNLRVANRKIGEAKPAALILIDAGAAANRPRDGQLMDPESPRRVPPRIILSTQSAVAFFGELKTGSNGATATLRISAPRQSPVELHNVIGILRGSDPGLKDTAVVVSAHYDHVGERRDGTGDRIFNGANDDGSGTVTVIELARALSSLKERPKRSIIFMTFFGEEKGLMGSRYYTRHPAWPIEKTIAQLNLEQVGRTDSTEGPQLSNLTVTGYDYSDVPKYIEQAGKLTGIKVYQNARNSDLYFNASDNGPFAEAGIPAHSLTVAFDYPDYHAVGDEWQKIDYDNMAKVGRAVGLTLVMLASSDQAPHWNDGNPRDARYLKAWEARH